LDDASRTSPYEDQLTNIKDEIIRLETSAKEYETQISSLVVDASSADTIVAQIATINATITKVEGQIASGEREQIKQAQSTIGANPDGAAGPNTRRSANTWIEQQKIIVNDLNAQVATIRKDATSVVNLERTRLASVVKDIREIQIPALKQRELQVLSTIDNVRATESPAINTAREEIARIRLSAENQIQASQDLIERLRQQITVGSDKSIEDIVNAQLSKINLSNEQIEKLTEKKYELEADYRKLEAEVGPVKYIAELVYGEANKDMLESAVRWVIIILVLVFDPLAVILVISGISLIEQNPSRKRPQVKTAPATDKDNTETLSWSHQDLPTDNGEVDQQDDKVLERMLEKADPGVLEQVARTMKEEGIWKTPKQILDETTENLYTDEIMYKGISYVPGNPEYRIIKELIEQNPNKKAV